MESALRVLLIIYVVLNVLVYVGQAALIFPGRSTQGQGYAQLFPQPGAERVDLHTTQGEKIVALFGTPLTPDGKPLTPKSGKAPTILYFYGNGMCLSQCMAEFERFRRLGANVLIPEYVGYGLSSGSAGEAGCYASANAAWDYLQTRPEVDPARIIITGWSLGGAVAIDLASRKTPCGLATFCTFSDMREMARRQFALLPVSLLLRHRFASSEKLARVRCPILLGHGTADSFVPCTMADELAQAAGRPVTRLIVTDAGHTDYFDRDPQKFASTLSAFLHTCTSAPATGK